MSVPTIKANGDRSSIRPERGYASCEAARPGNIEMAHVAAGRARTRHPAFVEEKIAQRLENMDCISIPVLDGNRLDVSQTTQFLHLSARKLEFWRKRQGGAGEYLTRCLLAIEELLGADGVQRQGLVDVDRKSGIEERTGNLIVVLRIVSREEDGVDLIEHIATIVDDMSNVRRRRDMLRDIPALRPHMRHRCARDAVIGEFLTLQVRRNDGERTGRHGRIVVPIEDR